MTTSNRETRAAENEDLFRRLNERLHTLATIASSSVLDADTPERFLCECSQTDCARVLELTPSQYREVRATNRRFLVFPDATHTQPDLETVIEEHPGFWVVEKNGEAGEEAENLAEGNRHPL
jgi:hypothetical protein